MKYVCPLLFAAAALAQTAIPDTPAGQRLRGWLEAVNSADAARIEAFHKEALPEAGPDEQQQRVQRTLNIVRQTGGFELVRVLRSAPRSLRALLKEKNADRTAVLGMEVAAEPPHRIANIGLRPAEESDLETPQRTSETEALAQAKAQIEKWAAADRFSGAVIVAKNGRRIFEGAWGFADREAKVPNTLDTKFNLGSMNKMFTAIAVAQLAQAGKLKFTDTVGKWLPDYPNPEFARKVTIHHLLTHTGGAGDIFGPKFFSNIDSFREQADYVKAYGDRAPEFEPGTKWSYANYGFVLAGRIVEAASGMNYYDYVRKNIFAKAGMNDSGSYFKNEKVPKMSTGYDNGKPNYDSLPLRGSAAGGGYSTPEDLLKFAAALLRHKLLDRAHTELVTAGKVDTGIGKYGYGFGDFEDRGVRFFGHSGGAPGINSDLRIFPASGYVIIVMGNVSPPNAQRVADYIGSRLPGR
jgi:CubicO group peptidase (beta-lactamase class C family)